MPMSLDERVRKASATHAANAGRRRHLRYVGEIREAAVAGGEVAESMAQVLRDLGYGVSAPRP